MFLYSLASHQSLPASSLPRPLTPEVHLSQLQPLLLIYPRLFISFICIQWLMERCLTCLVLFVHVWWLLELILICCQIAASSVLCLVYEIKNVLFSELIRPVYISGVNHHEQDQIYFESSFISWHSFICSSQGLQAKAVFSSRHWFICSVAHVKLVNLSTRSYNLNEFLTATQHNHCI